MIYKGQILVVTIDGPAGAGKSTIAKKLAKALEVSYLDTGAMYRALTLKAMRESVNMESEDDLIALAKRTVIDIENLDCGVKVFLDGEDVSQEIRTVEVTNNTFYIARAAGVRSIMVEWQREMGSRKSVVIEGRDVGTVVFPNATRKYYLDADVEERARRRYDELIAKGKEVDFSDVLNDVKVRDEKDFTRKVGPLKKAEDAVVIDSTKMTIDEVVEEMKNKI
ncbi:MAG: (d)CMP kinase [Candidatus Omnitrophica bacterium]|nr:(d)CMP kinase [Candidatus Omnitrophota bacterium]MBU1997284.1 (d)CMP kinase [Candidatus Omnitrophota bacterium]MBU4333159.1 (d)CMP kinase [Candidatus Omnitrophota bacterium]